MLLIREMLLAGLFVLLFVDIASIRCYKVARFWRWPHLCYVHGCWRFYVTYKYLLYAIKNGAAATQICLANRILYMFKRSSF